MEASITFKSVGKTFLNNNLLADLSFGVEKGSTFVLIGKNGSGKSIILKMLVGLISKDTGSIYLDGKDVETRSLETRSLTGYMPQYIDLDDEISVYENLVIHGQLHGLTSKEARKEILYWSELMEFSNLLNHRIDFLPYGIQRRIQFVRTILHNPSIIILDEPTTALDPHSRKSIWNVLDKLHENHTIIFATQNFREAERYADRIAILNDGNIKMDGTLERLIETTHGLTRYKLIFSKQPSEKFLSDISKFPRIVKAKLSGLELEFYSRERKQFFNLLKIALEHDLADLDTSLCRLNDLFIGLIDGGLE